MTFIENVLMQHLKLSYSAEIGSAYAEYLDFHSDIVRTTQRYTKLTPESYALVNSKISQLPPNVFFALMTKFSDSLDISATDITECDCFIIASYFINTSTNEQFLQLHGVSFDAVVDYFTKHNTVINLDMVLVVVTHFHYNGDSSLLLWAIDYFKNAYSDNDNPFLKVLNNLTVN